MGLADQFRPFHLLHQQDLADPTIPADLEDQQLHRPLFHHEYLEVPGILQVLESRSAQLHPVVPEDPSNPLLPAVLVDQQLNFPQNQTHLQHVGNSRQGQLTNGLSHKHKSKQNPHPKLAT